MDASVREGNGLKVAILHLVQEIFATGIKAASPHGAALVDSQVLHIAVEITVNHKGALHRSILHSVEILVGHPHVVTVESNTFHVLASEKAVVIDAQLSIVPAANATFLSHQPDVTPVHPDTAQIAHV